MKKSLTILGIPGSPRPDSYNAKILTVAGELAPPDVKVVLTRAFYNLPLSYYEINPSEYPQAVQDFKKEIASADAVLFSTPEYNYSFPSVLKNGLQWGGLPETDNAWVHKPAAVIGCCMDTLGTKEAVAQLRKSLTSYGLRLLPDHDVLINQVKEKFDAQDKFASPEYSTHLKELLTALIKLAGEN